MSYERDEAMRQQEGLEAMVRMREPRRVELDRDAKDYAIEHAGYLATAVEEYLKLLGEDDPHTDDLSDAIHHLRSAAYEFRKRAAITSPAKA